MASEADDKQPRCAGDRSGGDDDEPAGDAAFDSEDDPASVGDCKADVDRGDHRQPERVDGSRVQPPKGERCSRLRDADDEPPENRPSEPRAERLGRSGGAHDAFGVLRRPRVMRTTLIPARR